MANIGFKDRQTAIRLKQSLQPGQATPAEGLIRATEGYIIRTPVGGIPARVGDTVGSADCDLYYIDDSDQIVQYLDESGQPITIPVKNMSEENVAGSIEIQAKTVFGKLVCDYEPCTEGA